MRRTATLFGLASLSVTLLSNSGCAPHVMRPDPAAPAQAAATTGLAAAYTEVGSWVDRGAFPGAVIAVGRGGTAPAIAAFGHIEAAPGAAAMPADAIFDLASLTKVVATTTAAAILYDRGKLDLDAPVGRYLPAFGATAGHGSITVRHLLTHSSNLAPSGLLWKQANDRAGILRQIDAMGVAGPPGEAYRYQDINLILIGEIIERISGRPLDRFVDAEIFRPLGMKDTGFRPPAAKLARIAPTEQDDELRHTLVRGVVHDENAYLMGGVAGHAGLFSTARDLAKIAQFYLDGGRAGGRQLVRPETVRLFMARQGVPSDSNRALGWDKPGAGGGLAGSLASPNAIMHTGFTGTSIYIDPDRNAYVILLSNRVNPTRESSLINQARPAIHTAVLSALDAQGAK